MSWKLFTVYIRFALMCSAITYAPRAQASGNHTCRKALGDAGLLASQVIAVRS